MRSRKFRRILGTSLSFLLVVGATIAWFLTVQAGIAQWSPPKIQMVADGEGSNTMCAVADNKVYCWGSVNTYGQLGTGDNTTVSYIPRQINDPNGVLVGKTITAIAATRSGTVCVVASNVPYCWGRGNYGALGDNTTSDRYYPSAVTTSGVLSGKTITSMGTGDGHVCVVASGAAYCWGANGDGRLGDGSTTQRNMPVAVSTSGVLSGKTVTSISAASGTTCAVASGASYCWGNDANGYLGNDSSYTGSTTPVAVDTSGVMSGKTIVSTMSGTNHTCALASDSTAFCWGEGAGGQLGNNATPANSAVPVQVYASGAISGKTLTRISAGNGRSCVIDSNGDAYCWGLNPVGDGSGTAKSQPTKITGASTLNGMKIAQTVNSSSGSCFLTTVNKLYCAASGAGILGNNTSGTSNAPVQVLFTATFNAPNYRLYENANSATPGTPLAGINTAAAMTSYGEAFRVRLGIKTTAQIGAIAAGGRTSCALSDGKAYCWGRGTSGQIGDNGAVDMLVPSAVSTAGVLSGKTIKTVSVGYDHACAIASDDNAYCWGDNSSGQLGDNSTTQRNVPVAVNTAGVLSGKTIKSISTSGSHTCVIASDDLAYCWGDNSVGELGDNSTTQRNTAVAVNTAGVLSGKKILSVSAGDAHTCVIASDNNAYCWGDNTDGKLGDNSGTERHIPVAVYTAGVLSGKTVRSISAGTTHTCAIASDNNAYCWGWNYHGQLGDNTSNNSSVPVAVYTAGALSGKTILTIATGHVNGYGSCAIASDNNAYCWGGDELAAVAVDTSGVLSGKTVQSITMGDSHMCVIASDNSPYCWGMNWSGEVGNGNSGEAYVASPAAVLTDGYINGPDINPSDNTYKLQFAQKTVSSCTTQTGFADVTGSTAIAFNTNAGVSNGASITSNANDPVPTTDSVPQTYISASGTFTNSSLITGGKTGLWDFSLKDNSGNYGTSYCLRLTYGDSTPIEGTVQYPEIQTVGKKGIALPASRFYQNADSATPGSALANTNSVSTLGSYGQAFRVRIGLTTSQQPTLYGKTILSVSTGSWHTCAIASDNKAYCWGENDNAQLGTGDNVDARVPVAVDVTGVLSGKTITQVAAGTIHTCALTSEGKVYCWGDNYYSQLGEGWNGGSEASPSAVDMSGVLSGKTVQQIAVSRAFSCALTTEGKVYCWGKGDYGELGDGNATNSNVPVAVDTSGVLSGKTVTKVSLTEGSACVLTSDSAVYCWGGNYAGELGVGSTGGNSTVPVGITMSGALSGKTISEMSAGGAHVCVLASDNKPYCWGYNQFGQVGDNTNGNTRNAPVAVVTSGALSGKTLHGLDSGYEGTCILDASNNIYCWGMGTHGELGNGANSDSATPVAVTMGGALSGKTVSTIDAGFGDMGSGAYTVCARTTTGEVYCWGRGGNGQLGNNGISDSNVPAALVTDGYGPEADIAAGANAYKLQFAQKTVSTCSTQTGFADVTASSAIAFNVNGSVSNGAAITTNANDPVATANSVAQTYISAVGNFTNTTTIPGGMAGIWDFSLKDNSALYNTSYCLRIVYSDGSTIDGNVQYPEVQTVPKIDLKSTYRLYQNANSITPGTALGNIDTASTLNSLGQSFRVRMGARSLPKFSGLTTGHDVSCAIYSGNGYCWGQNDHGQMGRGVVGGQYDNSDTPIAVDTAGVLSGKTLLSISAGGSHTCAIASDNLAYCWGDNSHGELGNNSTTQANSPVAVSTAGVLSGKTILSISASQTNTCVIASDHLAYCWGDNTYGQIGNNSTTQSLVPVAVSTAGVLSGKTVLSISNGVEHTCAIASDNLAYCWGHADSGQLGYGSTAQSNVPVAVSTAGVLSGKTILSISSGAIDTCVIASDNLAYCWGGNFYGQLGDGTNNDSGLPVAVSTAGVLSGKTLLSIDTGDIYGARACAIASDNKVYCWGRGDGGELGTGSNSNSNIPVAVDATGVLNGKTLTSVQSASGHTCVLDTIGSVYCWGINWVGQTGVAYASASVSLPTYIATNGYVSGPDIAASANLYKLQFAQKTVSTCSAQTGFADVTSGTAIAFNTNGSVSNGASITTNANDPVPTADSIAETYISASGNFTNSAAITSGKAGIWDFSLKENSGADSTSYCLRLAYNDGTAVVGQIAYPEVRVQVKKPVVTAPYRFYQNANSLTPGSPLGVTGQTANLTSPNQAFRLRTGIMGTLSATKIATGTSHTCMVASSDNNAYCWGMGANGQLGNNATAFSLTPTAVDTSGVLSGKTISAISSGSYYSCVIASDNNAYCWGDNTNGQLGNNSTAQSNVPVAVNTSGVLSGKTILAISTNTSHTCVIASDNNAYCWGLNTNGQLGNNSTSQSLVPVAVNTSGVLSGKTISAIRVGTSHTCVIASDNNAYCWGLNTNGQLGNNSTTESHVAVAVNTAGVLSGKTILSLSAGNAHNCVIASDNLAYCWGAGGNGRLGNNSGSQSLVPVAVNTAGVLSGKTVTSIAAGSSHTCAIASDSLLYCWGYNLNGYLGNNSTTQSQVPVAVDTSGFLSGKSISSVASKFFSTCAVSSDNQVYCWGNNGSGQLGAGDNVLHLVPQRVVNYLPGHKVGVDGKTAVAVTTGMFHTCTIASDNNAYCWGYNSDGQLGNTGVTSSVSPTTVAVDTSGVLSGKTILSITAGYYHTCVIASDNNAYCWGGNGSSGKLGNNSTVDSNVPVAVDTSGVLAGKTILSIATSFGHTCVIASDNKAYCWGGNLNGQLGNNSTSDSMVPVAVDMSGVLAGKTLRSISTGTSHTCAIASDNQAYCWGYNSNWQLGNNSSAESHVPVAVNTAGVLAGKTVLSITAGSYHTCVVASDNKAYCWGQGSNGKLGNNATGDAHVPVAVDTSGVLSGKTILSITAGHFQTCAIASDNQAYCWGFNTNGQLGNNSTTTSLVPVAVDSSGVLSGKAILSIETGDAYVCALASDNQVYCWGQNNLAQLGDGSYANRLVPVLGYGLQYVPLGASITASTNSYTLQYATKSAGTCSAQTTGFADVTASTPIAFNTNASATSGTAISTTANDPLGSGQTVVQTYISAAGAFTNTNAITTGSMGLWDFSLRDNGAPYNTTYCLRVAYDDGTALTDAQALPEVRTTTGTLSVGFVNALGVGLSGPTTTFSNVIATTTASQTATGTFGTSNQKLRVYNDLATNGWSASIAATNGPTALWDRTDHVVKYDFNDASGANDGGDTDALGGALTLFPNNGAIASPSGCGTTGLSLGSQASFNEGSVNSITLFSATNTAAMGCAYDLTGVGLSQAVPAAQATGTYTIDMTVTVVAL